MTLIYLLLYVKAGGFIMHYFLETNDGYYSLNQAGTIFCFVIAALLFVAATVIKSKVNEAFSKGDEKEKKASMFSVRQLAFSGVALALAYALSYVKLIHMPWGGSVTLCSMLFVCLIGYWYGPRIGLVCAFTYSLLQFVQAGGSYIVSPLQVALDYLLAFTALGLSGFFSKIKNGLVIGYIVSVLGRFVFTCGASYLFWMDYMPEEFPKALSIVYPLCYNFAYMGVEAILTVAILMIKPVGVAMDKVRSMAEGTGK